VAFAANLVLDGLTREVAAEGDHAAAPLLVLQVSPSNPYAYPTDVDAATNLSIYLTGLGSASDSAAHAYLLSPGQAETNVRATTDLWFTASVARLALDADPGASPALAGRHVDFSADCGPPGAEAARFDFTDHASRDSAIADFQGYAGPWL
jgi:hypothetical protein